MDSGRKVKLQLDRMIDTKQYESVIMAYLGEDFKLIKSKSRLKQHVAIRHAAIAALRKCTILSFNEIGVIFNRDHSNCIYACKNVDKSLQMQDETSKTISKYFHKISAAINNYKEKIIDTNGLRDDVSVNITMEQMRQDIITLERQNRLLRSQKKVVEEELNKTLKVLDKKSQELNILLTSMTKEDIDEIKRMYGLF